MMPRGPLTWAAALLCLALSTPVRAEPACECPKDTTATVEGQPVDLNTASEAQLMELPGIGATRARAILEFRAARGGFTNVSQLMRIKGFGRAMLKRLRPLVTLSAPPRVGSDGADRVR